MLTARDELAHLATTLTDEQAERALEVIYDVMPELGPDQDRPDDYWGPCVVCNETAVNAGQGNDTCDGCRKRV